MVLLERVATLLHVDVEHLLDRTERPKEMLQQLVLDMENQLLQLKTQVVIALTTQRLLEQKTREQQEVLEEHEASAAAATACTDAAVATLAEEKLHRQRGVVRAYLDQRRDQEMEAGVLREVMNRLQAKMAETKSSYALLVGMETAS